MSENTWQFQDAWSEAQQKGPQIITREGEKVAVVVSFEEYEKMTMPKTDLVTFLQNSPLADLDL